LNDNVCFYDHVVKVTVRLRPEQLQQASLSAVHDNLRDPRETFEVTSARTAISGDGPFTLSFKLRTPKEMKVPTYKGKSFYFKLVIGTLVWEDKTRQFELRSKLLKESKTGNMEVDSHPVLPGGCWDQHEPLTRQQLIKFGVAERAIMENAQTVADTFKAHIERCKKDSEPIDKGLYLVRISQHHPFHFVLHYQIPSADQDFYLYCCAIASNGELIAKRCPGHGTSPPDPVRRSFDDCLLLELMSDFEPATKYPQWRK